MLSALGFNVPFKTYFKITFLNIQLRMNILSHSAQLKLKDFRLISSAEANKSILKDIDNLIKNRTS